MLQFVVLNYDDEYTEDHTLEGLRKYGLFKSEAAVEKNNQKMKDDLLQRCSFLNRIFHLLMKPKFVLTI